MEKFHDVRIYGLAWRLKTTATAGLITDVGELEFAGGVDFRGEQIEGLLAGIENQLEIALALFVGFFQQIGLLLGQGDEFAIELGNECRPLAHFC